MFLWAIPVALLAFVLALLLPQVKLQRRPAAPAADLGEGFGLPEARPAEDRIAQRVANVLYARGRQGCSRCSTGPTSAWTRAGSGRWSRSTASTEAGRTASVQDVAATRAVPAILLQPAFDDLAARGLIGGPPDDLRMTAAGEEVIERLGDTFRTWLIANLRVVDPTEAAALDAVIARIVRRVVREEAEIRPIVAVGAEPV